MTAMEIIFDLPIGFSINNIISLMAIAGIIPVAAGPNGLQKAPSAMEWQQPSRLPTTSSGEIYMSACKLPKHQRVSSGLSHLIKRIDMMNTLWQEEEFEQMQTAIVVEKGSRN